MGKQNGSKTEAKRKHTRNQKAPQNSELRTQKFFYGSVSYHPSVSSRENPQNGGKR